MNQNRQPLIIAAIAAVVLLGVLARFFTRAPVENATVTAPPAPAATTDPSAPPPGGGAAVAR